MQAPKFWYPKKKSNNAFISWILLPISYLIYFIAKNRFKNQKGYTGNTPIICVGNVTAGGTGKTPTAIYIAKIALEMKLKVAFLTKGYGGKIEGPHQVVSTNTASETGDEALILNIHAPCFIAKNRIAGAYYIDALKLYDLIITDDGLQNHPSLYQNCAFLTIDQSRLFGNERLIPAGPLREPVKVALNKASHILLIRSELIQNENNMPLPPPLMAYKNRLIMAYKRPIIHGPDLKGENVALFSGLGNNQQFFQTIKATGAIIHHQEAFPDHYQYTDRIIERLIDKAHKNAALLVTTEKDMVKINSKFYPYIIPFIIELDICEDDKLIIQNKIKEICAGK